MSGQVACKYWYWQMDVKEKENVPICTKKLTSQKDIVKKRSRDRSLDIEISESRGRDEGRRRGCRKKNNSKERSKSSSNRRHSKRRSKSSSCEDNQSYGSFGMPRLEKWEK